MTEIRSFSATDSDGSVWIVKFGEVTDVYVSLWRKRLSDSEAQRVGGEPPPRELSQAGLDQWLTASTVPGDVRAQLVAFVRADMPERFVE